MLDKNQIEEIVAKVLEKLAEKRESSEMILFPEKKEMGVETPRNRAVIERAQQVTPARIGIGRTGTRMKTKSYLQFRIDHAAAQDAVLMDVNPEFLEDLQLPVLETMAQDMETYLMDLDSGRKLNQKSVEWLQKNGDKQKQVQIIVCDGLSTSAIVANIHDLLPALMQGLALKGVSVGQPFFIKRSRVWVQDHVASILDCDLVISLIGERPGLATAESISAYMVYRPDEQTVEADRTVISNIHRGGLSPIEAGAYLADIIANMLKYQASGVKFSKLRNHQVHL